MTHSVPDLRAFLRGRWRTERVLRNRADGTTGTFSGHTTFTDDGAGRLRWHEEGTTRWPGFTGPAHRDYLVAVPAASGPAEVLFEDGRPFHLLDLTKGSWVAEHPCSPDAYTGRFLVSSPNRLEYEWEVIGPAKDQLLTTVLHRVEDDEALP